MLHYTPGYNTVVLLLEVYGLIFFWVALDFYLFIHSFIHSFIYFVRIRICAW